MHGEVLSGTREEAPSRSHFEQAADEAREIMRLVEARVVYVKAQVQAAVSQFLGELSPDAGSAPATPDHRPSADDLEQYALAWSPLLETTRTDVLATLAWHLTQERGLSLSDRPLLCEALGLTRPEVLESLQRLASDQPTVRTNSPAESEAHGNWASEQPAHAPSVVAMARHAEWLRLAKGQVLCEQGAPSDCMYAVISGRLRAVVMETKGGQRAVADLGKGQTIGEMGLLTGEPRSATVIAVRDCEVVKLSKAVFDDVVVQHPRALLRLTRDLAQRLRQSNVRETGPDPLSTIAVVPASPTVPLAAFVESLVEALRSFGPVLHLSRARLDSLIARGSADLLDRDPSHGGIVSWLNDHETAHTYTVYEADSEPSAWTARCLRQADRVVIVGLAVNNPAPGATERLLASIEAEHATPVEKHLVLLHPFRTMPPMGTHSWLEKRSVATHHHVALDHLPDVERVARRITGRGIGLVLSGGARGFAHIGVLGALRESGIPIDVVAGTSMGATIGAQAALEWDQTTMVRKMRKAFLSDYTLPFLSAVVGQKLAATLQPLFEEKRIEDLWTGYFCVSSSLSRAEVYVHTAGPIWRAVQASSSVPGLAPPVLESGELLVDGGVLNNLPADVMRSLCPRGTVIAVDVTPREGLVSDVDFSSSVSSLWLLANRLTPKDRRKHVPSLNEVLERTVMLGSVQKAQSLERTAVDLYLQPPTDTPASGSLSMLDEMVKRSHTYAQARIEDWLQGAQTAAT